MPRKFSLSSLWGQSRQSRPARRSSRPRKRRAARRQQPFRFAPLGLEMLEDLDLLSGTGEQLVGSETVEGDNYGTSVAVSGDWAVVGAPRADGGFADSGEAYVYHRHGGLWTEFARLTAGVEVAGAQFGRSVDIWGSTIVVGTFGDSVGGLQQAGSAYVFDFDGTTWNPTARLTASDAAAVDRFGLSVAIHEDTIVVGAILGDGVALSTGSAYVFGRAGGVWTEQHELFALDGQTGDQFHHVAVWENTVAVGALTADHGTPETENAGAAYLFNLNDPNPNASAVRVVSGDPSVNENFGIRVALGDGLLAVTSGADPGSVYVFSQDGSTWSQEAQLFAAGAESGDDFGDGLALFGDRVLVGASAGFTGLPGRAHLFERIGSTWLEIGELPNPSGFGDDWFGVGVAMDAESLFVGAQGLPLTGSGAAFAYANPTSAFEVTSTADSGLGSLRQAIENANASPGHDFITFAIPDFGVQTIFLESALPAITEEVTIDGFSQGGLAGIAAFGELPLGGPVPPPAPLVELSGFGVDGNGLEIAADNVTVRGLAINRFGGHAILAIHADGVVVEENYLGLDPWGEFPAGNAGNGVELDGTTAAVIRRNFIVGNAGFGILVNPTPDGAPGNNVIQGNFIGVGPAGTPMGNALSGVAIIGSDGNLVGGTQPGEGNVIAYNGAQGVAIASIEQVADTVTFAGPGISLQPDSSYNFAGSRMTPWRNALTTAANFGSSGIFPTQIVTQTLTSITPASLADVDVFVSSWWADTSSAAHAQTIVDYFLSGGSLFLLQDDPTHDRIGELLGLVTSASNGTVSNGIPEFFNGPFGTATDITQSGNTGQLSAAAVAASGGFVGATNAAGQITAAYWLPGAFAPTAGAMVILADVDMISTGFGPATYEPLNNQGRFGLNVAAFLAGQTAVETFGVGNSILGNSIYDNDGMEIDLGADGVTPNDAGDRDDGANRLLNFPDLAEIADPSAGVAGMYDGAANSTFRLEFFASSAVDPSGHGGGRTFLGAIDVTTDSDGHAEFAFGPEGGLPLGQYLAATATDAAGNTSEFSLAQRVQVVISGEGNGGFETGDFSGWSVNQSRPDLANVVTEYLETAQTYVPVEGEFFALLRTGFEDQFTSISQDFTVAAGEAISGFAFFDTTEFDTFYNDEAEIRILQNGQVVATVFAASVVGVGGNDGATPWTFWSHTFDVGGTYTLEARITNRQDGVVDSFLGIDAVEFHGVGTSNAAPQIASLTTDPAVANQFESVELTVEFADPNASDAHLVTVDWGDGTSPEVVELPIGARAATISHVYGEFGLQEITVAVADQFGAFDAEVLAINVNPAAPQILQAGLAPQSDSGVAGDNLTNLAQPSVLIGVFDPSPSDTGALTFRLDVYNDGVFDQETTLTADGNSLLGATIPLAQPLAEGTHTIGVEVRDADGNASQTTFQIVVDRTPPLVVATSVSSLGGGLQFVIELSENLNPAAAANLAHYLLQASGGDGGFLEGDEIDRTGLAQVTYFDAAAGQPPRIVVFAPLADETYRLTVDVDALVDRAGNARTAGDLTLRAVHDTVGPQVERVVPFNALGGQPNAILIDFVAPLDPASVVPANFTLELQGGGVLPLEVLYTAFGNRVIARVPGATAGTFAQLAAGSYVLTISGLQSAAGTPQDQASVHTFDVATVTGMTLNAEVLSGNAESLNNFTTQLLEQAETAHAALSGDAFLQSVLAAARDAFQTLVGTQEEIADAVSQVVLQLFADRAEAQGNQNEYIIVWGRCLTIELPDAIILSLPEHPEWSMAVLRVQAAAGSPLVTSSQAVAIVTEGVTGAMDDIVATLTGVQEINSGGVIYINPQSTGTEAFLNVALTGEQRTLAAENISGFSLVEAIDAQVQADFAALLGVADLSQVPGSFLIIWFDPVDFVLTDSQGQQIGHAGGSTVNEIPNAFYSGDGTTELLVIPNAVGGDYNLSLVGAGSEFRGTATFVSNGQVVNVPLQGTLAAGNNVVAVLDFRGLGEPLPQGQEFTGLERSNAGLEALAAAFSNAALAGIVSFAAGQQDEVRARQGNEALPPTAAAGEFAAFVFQQADGVLLTTFAVPAEPGTYRLGVVELQTDDRGIAGPRPVEVRLDVRDESSDIQIVFDRDLAPEQVAAAERLTLVWAGADGQFDTPDDQTFEFAAEDVEYDARTKTLRVAGKKLPPGKYVLKLDLAAAAGDAAANGEPAAEADAPPAAEGQEAPDGDGAALPADADYLDAAAALDRLWKSWPAAATTEELLARLRPADVADQHAWFERYDEEPAAPDESPYAADSRFTLFAGAAAAAVVVARPRIRIRRRR